MTRNNNTQGREISELIRCAENLLAFHKGCGLDYPSNDELRQFLKNRPVKKSPADAIEGVRKRIAKPTAVKVESEEKICKPDELAAMIAECRACSLGKSRSERIAATAGKNRRTNLLVICDPPFTRTTRAPIQGEAATLLEKMLAAIDLKIEEVYLTGLTKCFPAGGKPPGESEIRTCLSWLGREVATLSPKAIFTLGPLSAKFILDTKSQFFTLRGKLQKWRDIPLVPSYHPDMLLKHEELKKASWDDLKLIKRILSR